MNRIWSGSEMASYQLDPERWGRASGILYRQQRNSHRKRVEEVESKRQGFGRGCVTAYAAAAGVARPNQ
jgi:hypothetical protein